MHQHSERLVFGIIVVLLLYVPRACCTSVQLNGNCTKAQLVALPNASSISDLNVTGCANLNHLENAFFIRYISLSSLEISECRLSSLEDYALHGLSHLSHLSLARNNISTVRSWSNEDMSSLVSLDLRRNTIRQLSAHSFERYSNLQRLNLASNQLIDIEDDIFRGMPHLKYLNLGRNRLTGIEARNFHGMLRLTHLHLHFNAIESIEREAFQHNSQLRSLRLEGNRLATLDFMRTPSMLRLVLLNVSHNALTTSAFNGFGNFSTDYELSSLDLSYNGLENIRNSTFNGFVSLVSLNISHNSLLGIEPGSFDALELLQYIDLSANNLTHLPEQLFKGSTLLRSINLSDNKFQFIADDICSGMPFLSELNMARNRLEAAEFIGDLSPALNRVEMSLDLSGNQYDSLDLSLLTNFRRVELAGNRWNCDWLIREMMGIPPNIHFGREYSIAAEWSTSLLDVSGIDCYDVGEVRRTIVVLYPPVRKSSSSSNGPMGVQCETTFENATPPPFIWPKMRMDKFDSRSVIIWMLIAIAIVFAGLRVSRKLIEQKQLSRQRDIKLESLRPRSCIELQRSYTIDEVSVTESEDTTALVALRNATRRNQ